MDAFAQKKTTGKNPSFLAYQYIKDCIVQGTYFPSQHLVEIKLAQEIGVSRHNIRLALDRLNTEGLVRIEPNRGAIVAAPTQEEILDILAAREALEVAVTRMAVDFITTAQVRQLESRLAEMREFLSKGEYDAYRETNKAFHKIIFDASKTKTIPELIEQLRSRMARLPMRILIIPGRGDQSYAEHKAIMKALKVKNAEEAERSARKHIKSLKEAIQKSWDLIRA